MTFANLILIAGGALSGLLAGLLYAFTIAVIPGLRDLSAREHIRAMQAINIRIINPLFIFTFLGPTVFLALAAWLHRGAAGFPLLVMAAGLHMIGVFGVTGAGNVPLNNQLAQVDADALSEAEAERVRHDYHRSGSAWMRWHHLRTLAAVTATVLVFSACLLSK